MSAAVIREQIHEALEAVLAAALPPLFEGIRVERNRDAPTQKFPAVNVLDGGNERVEPESTGFNEYTMTPAVEGYVQTERSEELGPAMNELYGQVILALMADRSLGGLAIDMAEGPMTVEIGRRENQGPVAGFRVEISVRFWTAEDNPYQLGPGV